MKRHRHISDEQKAAIAFAIVCAERHDDPEKMESLFQKWKATRRTQHEETKEDQA